MNSDFILTIEQQETIARAAHGLERIHEAILRLHALIDQGDLPAQVRKIPDFPLGMMKNDLSQMLHLHNLATRQQAADLERKAA